MNFLKDTIENKIKKNKLSKRAFCKAIDYPHTSFNSMLKGERPYSETVIQELLVFLEVSRAEFDSWLLLDKYSTSIIKRAFELKKMHEEESLIFTTQTDKLLSEINLSRTQLAKKIKYDQGGLNKIIIGKESCSKSVKTRLADFFNIAEEEIEAWIVADKNSLEALELAKNNSEKAIESEV